jgi:hypothetical protein
LKAYGGKSTRLRGSLSSNAKSKKLYGSNLRLIFNALENLPPSFEEVKLPGGAGGDGLWPCS